MNLVPLFISYMPDAVWAPATSPWSLQYEYPPVQTSKPRTWPENIHWPPALAVFLYKAGQI